MRRKWLAPNNPTGPARQVWVALFPGHAWPSGWRVEWAGFMRGCSGLTLWGSRRVVLSHGDHAGPVLVRHRDGTTSPRSGAVETLLHEFVHVRAGHALRHGAEFTRLENALRERLGLDKLS